MGVLIEVNGEACVRFCPLDVGPDGLLQPAVEAESKYQRCVVAQARLAEEACSHL